MLRYNKKIAIVMAFVFCLSFMAPAFIAPSVAEAAFTATVAQSNYVPCTDPAAAPPVPRQNLGYFKVEVNVSDWSAATPSELLVTYPTRLAAPGVVTVAGNFASLPAAGPGSSGVGIVVPADASNAFAPGADIVVPGGDLGGVLTVRINNVTNTTKDKGWFYVHLFDINTANFSGDVEVKLAPQSGTAFGTLPASAQVLNVGKVNVTGTTTTVCKSIEKITSGGGGLGNGQIDSITIFENMPNTIKANPLLGPIELEIQTKGYSWGGPFAATGLFAFQGGSGFTFTPVAIGAGDTTAVVNLTPAAPVTASGAVAFSGLRLVVDEKVAKVGQDIEVKVSGAGITEQTIVVAQYVDYVANVIEDTTTELTAGLEEQELGTFFIEEVAPGTLVEDRSILMELPPGVEWDTAVLQNSNYEVVNNSAITFNGVAPLDNRTMKFTVNNPSQNSQNGAKVKFKGLKVDVSPSFTGDVVLTVKGKAGVEGTAKVATVNPMITMTASAPEVNLGIKEQKVSDVEIVETKADTIVARHDGADRAMAFYLDDGFRFAKVPKVEVIEGDMVLEVNDVKIQAPASGQNLLIIPIRAASYKTPAKIKISDIYVTADRNAPVGDVILYAADTASYSGGSAQLTATSSVDPVTGDVTTVVSTNERLCNAFNNTHRNSFKYDTPASVAIAKNMTVPPVEVKGGSGSGTFVIGSNIYTVNGLTKIMDVAPYINNGRTFVPYRYLALALGVADDDIVWDDSTKKVTVTKGDIVVEATIGSTTLTVNGEAVTMDVAPEIKNGRTMLPARYLAEALGGSVGWDQATKTVVFEM